jgi:hypothetical protein
MYNYHYTVWFFNTYGKNALIEHLLYFKVSKTWAMNLLDCSVRDCPGEKSPQAPYREALIAFRYWG